MNATKQTVKMPAFLASALVNGDTSGLECKCHAPTGCALLQHGDTDNGYPCDFKSLQMALDYCAPGRVVSAEGESYFSRTCDLPGWHLGADMLDYVVLYPS